MDLSSSKKILAVALASSALLAGCHDDADAPAAPVATSEVSGIAVKGALQMADVVACAFGTECATAPTFAAASAATGFLGSDETDATGAYSIDAATTNAPVLVRMFSNANTSQVCDFAGCSESVGEGLQLSTVAFVGEEGGSVSAPVSVLSTLATDVLLADLSDEEEDAFATTTSASVTALLSVASSNALAGLGVSSSSNVFTASIVPSTTGDLGTDGADVELSVINASLGGVANTGETLGQTIARVSSSVSTFVTTAAAGGSADASQVAAVAASLSSQIATNAQTVGQTVDNTLSINAGNVNTIPDVGAETTGASSGGDSTGA